MNTLQIGDMIFVNRFFYWFQQPKRGDIIVFKYPENPKQDFIKRVIATEGDILDIRLNQIYINNQFMHELYIREPTQVTGLISFPYKVPDGCVFVMGDNRNNSKDSRFLGPLRRDYIKGKAFIIYWFNKNREAKDIPFRPWKVLRFQFIH